LDPLEQPRDPAAAALLDALTAPARNAPESGIVEAMNFGRRRGDVMPLWAGEGDLPTPSFICDAAARALAAGETFYTWQRGIPELREALARYHGAVYGRAFTPEHFYITGSGMQAIQIALAMVVAQGDELLLPTPTWPNAAAAAGIIGARAVEVPMSFGNSGWTLDHERLARSITPRTRALFMVSPSNPTGWTATHGDLRETLALARRHGLWIVADETYARFWYGEGSRAPSYLDVMEPDDRILFVNTFSKNWAMTGWRVGWIVAHPALGQVVENLIQYSTSGVAQFMQRAAVAAVEQGEEFVARQIARAREGRDIVADALRATGRCRFALPQGAFYLFFQVDGETDTRALTFRIIDEAGVGLAPGNAFGAGGETCLRLCFARNADQLRAAAAGLKKVLSNRSSPAPMRSPRGNGGGATAGTGA
jgi:aspartate/methionine/tyrosine aminotransferase